ncbi:MAG TPA: hypothetical protein PLJ21_03920 [Pseudobdellovibrionaceae bacterium]|nr:hypothetical protein [Pseudobdellovibrionaceae bacterium]
MKNLFSFKIYYVTVFFFLWLFTNFVFAKEKQNHSYLKKHYVITLHGVRGNEQSYGDFHKIVKQNLQTIDPLFEVVTINWTYPVGSALKSEKNEFIWNPHWIAKKFNEDLFLNKNAALKNLFPEDKISIIGYSMGGLMSMTWYYDTLFNFNEQRTYAYPKEIHQKLLKSLAQVENMIGLGAVYWGSLDAEFGWTFLENGDLSEVRRSWPKLKELCNTPEAKKMISLSKNQNLFDNSLDDEEKTNLLIKKSLKSTCRAVDFIAANPLTNSLKKINSTVLHFIKSRLESVGNIHMQEVNNMRLTSPLINEMRLNRIRHLNSSDLRNQFRARWSSIVGVFPCLGKLESGKGCRNFKTEEYKKVNDGFIKLFSGVYRRETDGPVMSPSAVADFIYYSENKGQEFDPISYTSFKDTKEITNSTNTINQEIFVENMHATVLPALESINGAFSSLAEKSSTTLRKFDSSLGTDVVIVNKECEIPTTCNHPNYKYLLSILGRCDQNENCQQDLLNTYFNVSKASDRMNSSHSLRQEMGSFVVNINIRLPLNYKLNPNFSSNLSSDLNENLLKYFKFSFNDFGKGTFGYHRTDQPHQAYGIQIARPDELMSSYATLESYSNMKVLRVFFVGRAWAKPNRWNEAQLALQNGFPLRFEIQLPGLTPRRVVAKVKTTSSTYIDLFMK